jgi:hypothetical protein
MIKSFQALKLEGLFNSLGGEREKERDGRGGNLYLSFAGMWVVMIINRWCMTVLSLGDGM